MLLFLAGSLQRRLIKIAEPALICLLNLLSSTVEKLFFFPSCSICVCICVLPFPFSDIEVSGSWKAGVDPNTAPPLIDVQASETRGWGCTSVKVYLYVSVRDWWRSLRCCLVYVWADVHLLKNVITSLGFCAYGDHMSCNWSAWGACVFSHSLKMLSIINTTSSNASFSALVHPKGVCWG